jgi:hypothetical protein
MKSKVRRDILKKVRGWIGGQQRLHKNWEEEGKIKHLQTSRAQGSSAWMR